MQSVFERLWTLGPAALVLKAILFSLAAIVLLIAFILLRRTYRKRFFAKRDARVFEFRQKWDALISGKIPYEAWRKKPFERGIVETIALNELEVAGPEESAKLMKFMRASGLIEKRIFEARKFTGWRRMKALVALGQTRAPEGIPALAEGLRDRNLETRLAALRGLGRMASPQAGREILDWIGERGLTVAALPLQSALINCCLESPRLLLPYVRETDGPVREVLGRVMGEVATPSIFTELLEFADDDLPELRAAAARAMSRAESGLALDSLDELSRDRVWFVRLRAIVSLGKLSNPKTIPLLLRGLSDSNRLVRLRAAQGIVDLKTEMAPVFERVVASQDLYALHAYLAALANADLRGVLEENLRDSKQIGPESRVHLQEVLQTGMLPSAGLVGPDRID